MTLKIPIWYLIPALMIYQLIFFLAFKDYTIQEWINGSGIVSLLVGGVYISEGIYRRFKK